MGHWEVGEGCGLVSVKDLPAVTASQMAELDRVMFEHCRLDVLQVMEVAGRAVASFARERFLAGHVDGRNILVLAGPGGNGGDGLVAARYLHGWGAVVSVLMARLPDPGTAAERQLEIARTIGVETRLATGDEEFAGPEQIIDGLLGFSTSGAPRGLFATLIEQANAHPAPVLAIDNPSGLDVSNGEVLRPCVRAAATLTLGLPKTGLLAPGARDVVGKLAVADIGIPALAFERAGVPDPRFSWPGDWVDLED